MSQVYRVVCISDTHALHEQVEIPEGDILIHAGDLTGRGSLEKIEEVNRFFGTLPHKYIVVIAGNHDFGFQKKVKEAEALMTHCTYLKDQEIQIGNLRIYGSPWQPWFHDWAFNLERGSQIREKWDLIPEGIDILVTHGPPYGHGDKVFYDGERVGCQDLLEVVQKVKPRYHIFGHIHEAYGQTTDGTTTFINASTCNLDYEPVHKPVVFEIEA